MKWMRGFEMATALAVVFSFEAGAADQVAPTIHLVQGGQETSATTFSLSGGTAPSLVVNDDTDSAPRIGVTLSGGHLTAPTDILLTKAGVSLPTALSHSLTGPFAVKSSACAGITLAAPGANGSSCAVEIDFVPTDNGAATNNFRATLGSESKDVALTGTASGLARANVTASTGGTAITCASNNTPEVACGNFTIVNSGYFDATVTVALSGTDVTKFRTAIPSDCSTLSKGESCAVTVYATNLDYDGTYRATLAVTYASAGTGDWTGQTLTAASKALEVAATGFVDDLPNPFAFAAVTTGASQTMASEIVKITGLFGNVPVTVTGGNSSVLSVAGRAWSAAQQYIHDGETLQVRTVSGAASGTSAVQVRVGQTTATWNVVAESWRDMTPDAITIAETMAKPNTEVLSPWVPVHGVNGYVQLAVTGGGSPQIRVSEGDWASYGKVRGGDSFQVRLTSHASVGSSNQAAITVGASSVTWRVTSTVNSDDTPDAFTIAAVDAAPNEIVYSPEVTISGLTVGASITMSGADNLVQVDANGWGNSGTVVTGSKVRFRAKGATAAGQSQTVPIVVGGYSTSWTVNTVNETHAPTFAGLTDGIGFEFETQDGTYYLSKTGTASGISGNAPLSMSSDLQVNVGIGTWGGGTWVDASQKVTVATGQTIQFRLPKTKDGVPQWIRIGTYEDQLGIQKALHGQTVAFRIPTVVQKARIHMLAGGGHAETYDNSSNAGSGGAAGYIGGTVLNPEGLYGIAAPVTPAGGGGRMSQLKRRQGNDEVIATAGGGGSGGSTGSTGCRIAQGGQHHDGSFGATNGGSGTNGGGGAGGGNCGSNGAGGNGYVSSWLYDTVVVNGNAGTTVSGINPNYASSPSGLTSGYGTGSNQFGGSVYGGAGDDHTFGGTVVVTW
ncbi:MAG: hypothetical protein HQL38_03400 [Alphaproteobacteria bacterium]|nr:hypothetical protein [Alphaproteobacteria bacterium]